MLIVSAAALVDPDGRILLSQRLEKKPLGGLWEFPGGKIESNENPEQGLIRELEEELGISVSQSCLAPLAFSFHQYPSFDILLLLFVSRKWEGIVFPREGQKLKWVYSFDLAKYPMPEADKPFIPVLRDLL